MIEWITVAAIVIGPVSAVFVTRYCDSRRSKYNRQYQIFSDLMKTRQFKLDPLHVAALNLVELEFYNNNDVVQAFRAYIGHLNSPMPMPQEQDRYFQQRDLLFVEMLQKIGKELGYRFDKQDLDRLGYIPKGWGDDLNIQKKNSQYLLEILSGQKTLPITVRETPNVARSPFPSAPE